MERVRIRYLSPAVKRQGRASYTAETRRKVTEVHDVVLHDGRAELPLPASKQLEKHGLALSSFKSSVHDDLDKIENPLQYRSDGALESALSAKTRETYFRECEALVQSLTGAHVAFAISHAVRNGAGNKLSSGVEYLTAYATFAHTDYTDEILTGAWKMLVKRGVSEERAKRMRIAFFNVWQPTRVPVEEHPLALLDWTSVDAADVVKVTLGYNVTPKGGANVSPPIGQIAYNPEHRWYFFPNMQTHEALVFTQVDSREGYPTHSFHTAVKHQTKPHPIPRESVEVRVICGFLGAEGRPLQSSL